MTGWSLPTSVQVAGRDYAIRSDFRAVLDALAALKAPELQAPERTAAFFRILFPDWRTLTGSRKTAKAALVAALEFIDLGRPQQGTSLPRRPVLVDWEKDAALIAPGIDKVLGYSCRRCAYLHWWEFVGAYMGIGQGLFAQVVAIRDKQARGKALDKHERQFLRENPELVALPGSGRELTGEDRAFLARLGIE